MRAIHRVRRIGLPVMVIMISAVLYGSTLSAAFAVNLARIQLTNVMLGASGERSREAQYWLQQALVRQPELATAKEGEAMLATLAGDDMTVIHLLAGLNEARPWAVWQLGWLYQKQGDTERAVAAWRQLPAIAHALIQQAAVASNTGDQLTLYDLAIQVNPQNPAIIGLTGLAYARQALDALQQQRPAEAEQWLSRIKVLESGGAQTRDLNFLLIVTAANHLAGNDDLAIYYAQRAIQIDPAHPHFYALLASAVSASGREQEAVLYLQEAIARATDIYPAFPYQFALGQIYEKLGDKAAAQKAYAAVLADGNDEFKAKARQALEHLQTP
jgi:tetratricopeptide (TPR) repeat protein